MNSTPVADVRNLALLGHTGSGKTSLVDALLFKAGVTDRQGAVSQGSSAADYTDQEKNRRISIFAKPFVVTPKGPAGRPVQLVVTDTPGYMDFIGQVVAACRAADAVLITVDAAGGVQVGTRRSWVQAERANLACGFVITALDKDNTDFSRTVEQIQAAFGSQCVPVVMPVAGMAGVVDILAAGNVPAALAEEVELARGSLIELAAETDDTLIEKFLAGEALAPDEIAAGLRAAVAGRRLMPIFVTVAEKQVGIDTLIDGVVRLFPTPAERTHADASGAPIAGGPDAPLVAQVWRSVNDPFVGQLNFVRVLGGTLKADSEVYNATREQKERVGTLLCVNGKKQDTVAQAGPGDIVAIPKLKNTKMGDTLCAPGTRAQCAPVKFPNPVAFMAVTAKTQADEDKLGTALSRVADEDPTLHVERRDETKEIVISGLGDVHIEVAVDLMKTRSNVEVNLHTPKVPYRETVTGQGEGHYRHKKQSGGRGQFGEVYLRVMPRAAGDEEWFVNDIVGGAIPGNFIPAVEKGLKEGLLKGAVAGFPVMNIKVSIYDGKYHDVDSSEIAFKIAGSRALRDGMAKAKPVLLEPIMEVKVMVPETNMGDISGDLNHKRGRILGMGSEDGMQVVTAEVPQAELFRYAAELRSMTGGQGTFEMKFVRYDIVPSNVAQKVVAAVAKVEEEED